MNFYWLELKKAKPLWGYLAGSALITCVATITSMSFIKTNGDVIHPEQLAESAWASAATQLYALFIGPVIVAILTGTLIKAEFHSQMVDILRSRGQHAGYKIAALIVSLAALGVILSAASVAGWLIATTLSDVAPQFAATTIAVLALRNIIAVVAWGLICAAIYIKVGDISLGFAACLALTILSAVMLVKFARLATYNPLGAITSAVGYPFLDLSVGSWLILAASLALGAVSTISMWRKTLTLAQNEVS